MFSIFKQPAPLYLDWKKNILRYIIVGCFIAFFLVFFQPFGTDTVNIPDKKLFLSGYGVITFLAFSFTFIVLPKIFTTQFVEEKWVLWKQILLTLLAMCITFAGCYLYMNTYLGYNTSFKGFLSFFFLTLPISIFPIIVISMLDYIYQLKKNQHFAQNLNQHILPQTKDSTILKLKDENGKEDISIQLDQLIFIKAANNYVEINYSEGEKIKKHLLRNSIKNIEEQLPYPAIKRCHRSYLVNMDKAGRITGNAQGYKIHFPFSAEFVVPVSRSKGKELLAILQRD